MAETWGWREVRLFIRFMVYSIGGLGAIATLWVTLDLPQVASKDYVNGKFQPVQSQLVATRLQLNKMTRQSLETEHYRLTTESKTNNTFDIQKRINDINDQLGDTQRERDFLLKN